MRSINAKELKSVSGGLKFVGGGTLQYDPRAGGISGSACASGSTC